MQLHFPWHVTRSELLRACVLTARGNTKAEIPFSRQHLNNPYWSVSHHIIYLFLFLFVCLFYTCWYRFHRLEGNLQYCKRQEEKSCEKQGSLHREKNSIRSIQERKILLQKQSSSRTISLTTFVIHWKDAKASQKNKKK